MALTVSFSGKRILVTGGGGGLGKAVAKKLYDDGAIVFVVDKNEDLIEQLKKECPKITAVSVDVTDFEKTRKLVETFLPLDHLLNNAGIIERTSFLDIDIAKLRNMFDVNFNSYVVIGQTVARSMIENKIEGSIVNVASVASIQSHELLGSYCCSKAAVGMLTKIMALELGHHNIRVNAISPAAMQTGMLRVTPDMTAEQRQTKLDAILDRNIIKKVIQPEEAADLILFLLSPASSMITGENVFIDGGRTCT